MLSPGSKPHPEARVRGWTGRITDSGRGIAIVDRQNLVGGLARSGFGRPDVVEHLGSADELVWWSWIHRAARAR